MKFKQLNLMIEEPLRVEITFDDDEEILDLINRLQISNNSVVYALGSENINGVSRFTLWNFWNRLTNAARERGILPN